MVQEFMEFGTIREPIVEGMYYPDNAEELEQTVRRLLSQSRTPAGNAFGIMAPHAAYSFSGTVVASAMKCAAAREIRHIVILAPFHREDEPVIFLPESTWYRTALGLVPIHTDSIRLLEAQSNLMVRNDIPHLEEFSIEVQLPFIQYLFPRASIVPLLVGATDTRLAAALAAALSAVYGRRRSDLLFMISANLTDYREQSRASAEASRMVERILDGDTQKLLASYASGEVSSCGAGCLAAFLKYDPFHCRVEIVSRGSSRHLERDVGNIVEYAAVSYLPGEPG